MSTIQPNVDYMIVNYNSGLVWAVAGGDTGVGASVVQFSWVIDPDQHNQRWNFVTVTGGWRIKTSDAFNGFYAAIDKDRPSGDNDAGVNVYPPGSVSRDVWALSGEEVGQWISIQNVETGKSCAVKGESTGSDAYVVQYDTLAQAGQRWMILPYIAGLRP